MVQVLTFLVILSCAAPASAWQFWLSSPRHDVTVDVTRAVVAPDGGTIVVGSIRTEVQSGTSSEPLLEQLVIKIRPDGTEAWRRRWESFTRPGQLEVDASGDVYVSGTIDSLEKYITKMAGDTGAVLWGSRAAGGIGNIADAVGGAIAAANDMVFSTSGDEATSFTKAELVAMSASDGQELWRAPMKVAPGQLLATSTGVFALSEYQLDQDFAGSYGRELRKFSFSGQQLWRRILYQDFHGRMASDSVGHIFVLTTFSDTSVSIEKINSSTGERIWRQDRPAFQVFGPTFVVDAADNILVSLVQRDSVDSSHYLRLLKLDGSDGSAISESDIPGRYPLGMTNGALGVVLFGASESRLAWVAKVDPSFESVAWERFFAGPDNNIPSLALAAGLTGDAVVVAARAESGRSLECADCTSSDVLVATVSAIDGSDEAHACGNGILDPGEQCDDGNSNAYDECPSRSSHECRFNSSYNLVRGKNSKPTKDSKGCQFEWYVANPLNARDKYDLPEATHRCQDGDPWCDFDAAAGSCSFRVVACLNNQDVTLPACIPQGISSLEILKPRFRPALASDEEGSFSSILTALLNEATSHLLDPNDPAGGFNVAVPLGADQMNACSTPMTITVPLAAKGEEFIEQLVTLGARTKGAGVKPKRHKAQLRLLCKPNS